MGEPQYIRFYVVHIDEAGMLEPVHPGALPFYSDAERIQEHYITPRTKAVRTAIIDEHTWDAYEDANAQSIHECQTERVMVEDERGSYWYCPQCNEPRR